MTTLIAWMSRRGDGKLSSLNIASDSRITWGTPTVRWDNGRKVFWSINSPDIFGFSGDVATMSTIISQLCSLIDFDILNIKGMDGTERHKEYFNLIKNTCSQQIKVIKKDMSIFHAIRDGTGDQAYFRLWNTTFIASSGTWIDELIEPEKSEQLFLVSGGTGSTTFKKKWNINKDKYGDLARTVFHTLIETCFLKGDEYTGGAPQMVRLGTEGKAKPVGIVLNELATFMGLPLIVKGQTGDVEWINENYNFLKGPEGEILSGSRQNVLWKTRPDNKSN